MKSDKCQSASNGKPLLHHPMSDKATAAVQRIKHPTLAVAVFRLLVPTDSTADRILNRMGGALSAKRQKESSPDKTVCNEHSDALNPPQSDLTSTRLNLDTLLRQVPKRLIIALCLLAAAVIISLFGHQLPL